MIFRARYSCQLEGSTFQNRTDDFIFMNIFGMITMLVRRFDTEGVGVRRVCSCICSRTCACVTVALTYVVFLSFLMLHAVAPLPQLMTLLVPMFWTPFLASSLIFMHCYLWSRFNHTTQVSIMGMVTVQAFYLPWCLVGLSVAMGASPVADLLVSTHTRTLLLHAARRTFLHPYTETCSLHTHVCVCVCRICARYVSLIHS